MQYLTMKEESNAESHGESASLLDKEESVEMSSLPSGVTSNENPESGPLKEERIEVGFDRVCCKGLLGYFPRIFEVVESGDPEALSNLLTNSATEVHSINSQGNTALHHAVASACGKGDWDDSLYQCIDVLMNCEQMNVNRPNKKGYTAIGLAVKHRTCVEHMLKHSSAGRLYLDYYPGDGENTEREIIMQTYPDLQLPERVMERLDSPDRNKKVLAALQRGAFEVFRECLNGTNVNLWFDEPYHSYLLEIACQMKNCEEFVKFLLKSGADVNIKNRITGMPLLQATARCRNFEVLKILLVKKGIDTSLKDNEKRTVLHWLAGVNEGEPGDKEKIEKCLKLLLKSKYIRKKGIDDRDSVGKTALYITVESGFRDRANLLLSKGADLRVFESGSKILLPKSLSIVEEFLEDCLLSNDKPLTSQDLQLNFNNRPLMYILPRIAESKLHRDLLKHPVMSAFLNLKWKKFRVYVFIEVAFYVQFLFFLTVYSLYSEPYNTVNDEGAASNTTDPFSSNDSNITSGMNDSNFTSEPNSISQIYLKEMLWISSLLLCLKQVFFLLIDQWLYVKLPESWLEILLLIATFVSIIGEVKSAEVKHHTSAVAVFLGWSGLLLILGRLPLLSVQYEMFRTVCWTFLRYMASYGILFIAFAFSFHIIFKGSSEQAGAKTFANPAVSLLKTIVMFTGEFYASDLPFDTLPYTSHVIFLLFVVLMAIVLLNLLNGLAVYDTEEIRKKAETLGLVATVKSICRWERTYIFFFSEPKDKITVTYPNWRNRFGSVALRSLLNMISKKKEPKEKDKLTEIQEELLLFKEKLSHLQFRHDELEKNLDSKFDETLQILRQILTARHEV